MAFWLFVDCRWCGYTGCAPPIGDSCPQCRRTLEPEPTSATPTSTTDAPER